MDTVLRQDLIEAAIRYTDSYLGVEKHAKRNGYATPRDIDDFSFYLSKAHDALTQLGDIDNHYEYMQNHVAEMAKLAGHDDSTLADIPSIHLPKSDYGEPAESTDVEGNLISEISQNVKQSYLQKAAAQVKALKPHAKKGEYKDIAQNMIARRNKGMTMVTKKNNNMKENAELELIDEAAETGLAAKAAKSGISIGTLRKVYSRGVAAWKTGHRPGTTPQQWGMARVNSYITKGKTYHTADKDLHEDVQGVAEGAAIRQSFKSFYNDINEAQSKKKTK